MLPFAALFCGAVQSKRLPNGIVVFVLFAGGVVVVVVVGAATPLTPCHSSTSTDVIKAWPRAEAFLRVGCCAVLCNAMLCQGSNFNIKIRLAFGPLRKPQNVRNGSLR